MYERNPDLKLDFFFCDDFTFCNFSVTNCQNNIPFLSIYMVKKKYDKNKIISYFDRFFNFLVNFEENRDGYVSQIPILMLFL